MKFLIAMMFCVILGLAGVAAIQTHRVFSLRTNLATMTEIANKAVQEREDCYSLQPRKGAQ